MEKYGLREKATGKVLTVSFGKGFGGDTTYSLGTSEYNFLWTARSAEAAQRTLAFPPNDVRGSWDTNPYHEYEAEELEVVAIVAVPFVGDLKFCSQVNGNASL